MGLVFSLAAGFFLSRVLCRLLPKYGLPFRSLQIAGAGLMAFAHGAQDGQKFLGILLLVAAYSGGAAPSAFFLTVLCALMMALGTAAGGRRIVETIGEHLVPLTPRAGFAADLSGGVCLVIFTLLGAPVSTTHTKAAAILGAGLSEGRANRSTVLSLFSAWLLTFPICFGLSYGLSRLFLS